MRLNDLYEAPLADFQFHGNRDEPASFRDEDLRAVRNPKWRNKVERIFSKLETDVFLHIINHDGDEMVPGIFKEDDLRHILGVNIQAVPEAINLVLTHNEGDFRVPLTPWIIAHRFAHAVFDSYHGAEVNPISAAYNNLNNIMHHMSIDELGTAAFSNITDFIHAIGTMRSAREGKLSDGGEFIAECFAQYLITGKITINKLENRVMRKLPLRVRHNYPKLADEEDERMAKGDNYASIGNIEKMNELLDRWRQFTERSFAKAINDKIGQIIVL